MFTPPRHNRFHLIGLCVLGLLTALAGGCASNDQSEPKKFIFYPNPPQTPRFQYLRSFALASDLTPERTKFEKFLVGEDKNELDDAAVGKPYGVAMHDGKIYTCDTKSNSVAVLDLRKKEMRLLGKSGSGRLAKPIAVAVADDGTVYVGDSFLGQVLVYGSDDRYIKSFGPGHQAAANEFRPVALALRGDELYVANLRGNRIDVLNRQTGAQVRTIGTPGKSKGQLAAPIGVAVDKEGNVYVTEMLNYRVQKFSPQGKVLMTFGSQGDAPGNFARPKHMAIDSEGNLYVVDSAFGNVQVFNSRGRLLIAVGDGGDNPGQLNLPPGVAVHEGDFDLFQQYAHPGFEIKRLLLVTSQFGPNRISVYAMGQPREGVTIKPEEAHKASATTRPASKLQGDPTKPAPPDPLDGK